MKKQLTYYAIGLILCLVFISGCQKRRNYYEDPDDAGLSRFTARGYNIATFYINDTAYINPYQSYLFGGFNSSADIKKIQTTSILDTISISWQGVPNDPLLIPFFSLYNISLLIPVEKSFTKNDFAIWTGKRFPHDSSTNATFQLLGYPAINDVFISDSADIYIVKVDGPTQGDIHSFYTFSCLFEANFSNGYRITKGRFDFKIYLADMQF